METFANNKRIFAKEIDEIRSIYKNLCEKKNNLEQRLFGFNTYFSNTKQGLTMDELKSIGLSLEPTLQKHFFNTLPNVKEYIEVSKDILDYENITLALYGQSGCSHKFILNNGDIECLLCHHHLKEYDLNHHEEEFFYEIINKRNLLIKVPFYSPVDIHLNPDGFEKDDGEPYLDIIEREEWIRKTIIDEMAIKLSGIENRNFFFWELLIARFEIELLAGKDVNLIYESLVDAIKKEALAKAYYNLSQFNFRINSGYFRTIEDAFGYQVPEASQDLTETLKRLHYNVSL